MVDISVEPTLSYATDDDPYFRRLFIRTIERVSGQPRLKRIYDAYRAEGGTGAFWHDALNRLEIRLDYEADRLARMPETGPLIVVANHPFGVLDGLVACHLVSMRRPDVKLMAHATFERAPELRPYLLPIHFDGASTALRENVAARRSALEHLSGGGAIVIFPAGRVSTAPSVFGPATDAPWKLFVSAMVQRSDATILPLFFHGQNSWLFHLASRLGEAWREALLLRELARRIGKDVCVNIGEPTPSRALPGIDDRHALLDELRRRVYALGGPSA